MRQEGKTPGDAMTSPFGDGKGATQATGPAKGAHDFNKQPNSSAPPTGFKIESRPQSEAKPENEPSAQEIPAGGKGHPLPLAPVAKPFKGMK